MTTSRSSTLSSLLSSADAWYELLEQIFEDVPAPLCVLDTRGQIVRQNSAQLAFNAVEGEKFGIGEFNVLEDPRSQKHDHAAHFRRALNLETVEYQFESSEFQHGEALSITYQRLFVPIGSSEGAPLVVLSALIDISEQRRAEQEKERLNVQLLHSQKLESLGVLAGGIAHDFNNLLMGVMGNASLVLAKLDANSPLKRHVEAIEEAARRAANVAQQMLAYAGRGRVERRHLDLSLLVEESADLFNLTLAGRIELASELTRPLPTIRADYTQLQQVVLNLVTNACEATHERAGLVSLRTGVTDVDASYLLTCFHGSGVTPGRFVFLEVEDQGHGMDVATLPRIFDPFFTTKFDGRGLGLAGVMGIVRGHKGAIQVTSAPGSGTCFRVLFPACSSPAEPRVAEPIEAQELPALRSVLVIDDEELVLETAVAMLEQLTGVVWKANSGRAAVELYRQHRAEIDVVLLDLTMPDLDGAATLRTLTALDPGVCVVIMSGYDSEEAMAHIERKQRTAFLRKPFSLAALEKALHAVHPQRSDLAHAP